MNSPQLWHCSGCHLCPTCFTFYLVRVQIFWNQGCTCNVEEHLRVWHVKIALLTRYGHRFWPDCWPWWTNIVFFSDQDQRQPSPPFPSPRVPFSSIALLVCRISPPMMYHTLPCSWATDMPLGISFLTLRPVSQLYFPTKIWLMLEKRVGWAGEGHEGAESEIPTLIISTRAQKDGETSINMKEYNKILQTLFL